MAPTIRSALTGSSSRTRAQRQVSASVPTLASSASSFIPHSAPRSAQRGERIGEQRVERTVGGGDVLPVLPDVGVDGVVGDRQRAVQIGVEAVLDPHSRVGDVAEDVGREQDRPREHDRVQDADQNDRPAFGDGDRARALDERDEPRVGGRERDQRDQEGPVAEALADPLQPAGDRRGIWGSAPSGPEPRRARSRRSRLGAAARAARERRRPLLRARASEAELTPCGDAHAVGLTMPRGSQRHPGGS